MDTKMLMRRLIAASGDYLFNYFYYYYLHIKKGVFPPFLNIKTPKRFNEKIIFLKIHHRYPDAHIYADKVLVRNYVSATIGDSYLIPILGIYSTPEDIDFSSLPERFILKTNHASGQVIICKSKNTLDIDETLKILKLWLKTNYYDIGREYQYKEIKPQILAEVLLDSDDEGGLRDYKIFCFNSEPKFIQVDIDRHVNHRRNFYDLEWNRLPFQILYPSFDGIVIPPVSLPDMIRVAHELSKKFVFSRIDLYCVGNKVYFGEITFHHEGGFGPITPSRYDRLLGDLIHLENL